MESYETEVEFVDSLNWISLPSLDYDSASVYSWSSWSSRDDPSFSDSLFPDLLDDVCGFQSTLQPRSKGFQHTTRITVDM